MVGLQLTEALLILACCGQKVPITKTPLIVVVDDDESVCRALKRLIGSVGMTAETYVSGREFLDLIEALPSFRPDCVVLDVQMPDLNGIEIQACLRRVRGEIPIIFVTAHDERAVRTQAIAAGAVAFLRKPFNDSLLIRTIRAALGRSDDGGNQNGSVWDGQV
jgi:FixJ family two-component response regulator